MQLITTPNPNAKKIEIEHGLEVGTVIKSTSDKNNTLCNKLISISGISTIFAGPAFLTLTKEDDSDWDSINDDIVTQLDKL
ncbi:NifU N-terminal domain-containing protein [Acidimicrobiia bacterium]|nr:NifU N-terminal domain-containing protein [Acidimicrobiia bacterium]